MCTGCLGGEVCKGQGDLSRAAREDPSTAQERMPDCSLGKGLWACVESMFMLAYSDGRDLLPIGLVAQPLCELHIQPLPTEPALRSDLPPFTVQMPGPETATLAKHSASEQHLLPWVQKVKDHTGHSSSSLPSLPIFLSEPLFLLGWWTLIQESSPGSPAVFVLGTRATEVGA